MHKKFEHNIHFTHCYIFRFIKYQSTKMQFLTNKGAFNFSVNTKYEAYSPFNQFTQQIQKKRSRLFPDRKRIPGRKTKFIFAIAFGIHFFASFKLLEAKQIYRHKAEEQRKMQRKAAPYFQSVADMEYTIAKHRTDLILGEALKKKGGIDYIEKNAVYHNRTPYIPARGDQGYHVWQGAGKGRYPETMTEKLLGTYLAGFNIQNA